MSLLSTPHWNWPQPKSGNRSKLSTTAIPGFHWISSSGGGCFDGFVDGRRVDCLAIVGGP
jgi:hypothetical protein